MPSKAGKLNMRDKVVGFFGLIFLAFITIMLYFYIKNKNKNKDEDKDEDKD